MATYRSSPTVPADIITYRLGTKLVYVKPADDYEVSYIRFFYFLFVLTCQPFLLASARFRTERIPGGAVTSLPRPYLVYHHGEHER